MQKRWDIFCKIVDNFGDIGVCWRLARQLHNEHGLQIRLWIDDLEAAQKIIPSLNVDEISQVCDEITILKWPISNKTGETDFSQAADVVIEAFACELPPAYLVAMAQNKFNGFESKWVNLEYLSAEKWVDDFHGKPSPQNFLNSNLLNTNISLTRYFYFPGFTEATGGLIREDGIAAQLQAHTNPRHQAEEGARRRGRGAVNINLEIAPLSNFSGGTTKHLTRLTNNISQVIANPASGREAISANRLEAVTSVRPEPVEGQVALKISLFCYPNAPIKDLFNALRANIHAVSVYIPASSIPPQIADFFGVETIDIGDYFTRENLHVHILPFLSQLDYDALLRDCDLNFVRGEDSWLRAIWAGKPFIWQPYLQEENTHIKKLNAFLDIYYADFDVKDMVCKAHQHWSVGHMSNDVFLAFLQYLPSIAAHTAQQSKLLAQQTDLATKLVAFCNKL